MSPDLLDELKTVDLRHAEVRHENFWRLGIQKTERLFSGLRRAHLRTGGGEQFPEQRQRIGIVIDGKHMDALQVREWNLRRTCW